MTGRHLAAFFSLSFAISWGVPGLGLLLSARWENFPFSLEMYTPFYYAGVWGPAVAAFIVVGRRWGFGGIAAYAKRILDWRLGWRWWLFALAGIPAMYFAGALIEQALGKPGAVTWYRGSWPAFALAFLLRGTAGPVEEFGWRGFALPLMQRRWSPPLALLVLALAHGLWHAPAFAVAFASGTHFGAALPFPMVFGRFMLNILIVTFFMNVAYNATGGRLSSAFLIHWMLNGYYPWKGDADLVTGQNIAMGLVALVMLAAGAGRWLRPDRAATTVLPAEHAVRARRAGDAGEPPGKNA